jgi:rubrerythrin
MQLKGSQTEENLKAAFAGESQANRRYLYFANKADVEGQNDVSALFRSTAEGETGHAHGHLDYLAEVGDPATGLPIGASRDNLKSAVTGSRRWPRPSARTPTASRKLWTRWSTEDAGAGPVPACFSSLHLE